MLKINQDVFDKIDKEIEFCIKLKRRNSKKLASLIRPLDDHSERVFRETVIGEWTFRPVYSADTPLPSLKITPPAEEDQQNEKVHEYLDKVRKLQRGELFNNKKTVICSRSGEMTDDFVIVDGEYVSRAMLTDFDFFCDWCHEYHSTTHTDKYNTVMSGSICERVANRYFKVCSYCGLYERSDCMRYDGRGGHMCIQCRQKLEKYQIRSYHNTPELVGYTYDKDTNTNVGGTMTNFKGYGIELEIDCAGESDVTSKDVMQLLNNEVYTMHDGSIDNGFEIITHPHTEDALYNMNWADTFKWLLKQGYRSHDVSTCGLHMHISRKLFQDASAICKMMYFYEKFRNEVIRISRRAKDRVDRWAGFYLQPSQVTRANIENAFMSYNGGGHSCRYKCVNVTNRNTVEIRIMRGTLKLSTFLATLDFIITVAKNANNISWENINDWKLWLEGLKDETVDYLLDRRAFYGDTTQTPTEEIQREQIIYVGDDEIETIKYRLEEIDKQCV